MIKNSVLLIFIDGLGIGQADEQNPLFTGENLAPLAFFKAEKTAAIFDGAMMPTDASLGIEGRPQSASGQTTILTGKNAPRILGFHKQGFPNQTLRETIAEYSVFRQLKNKNIVPNVFVNAYTPQFFETVPRWKSATTCAVEAADLQFRKLPDLFGRQALFHDFTNRQLIERGIDAPIFSPSEAAAILADLTAKHRFTLYEHFITDKIGHARDFAAAARHLPELAEFVRETLTLVDLKKTTVILTSDHGNIENLAIKNHTLNQVPTVIWGNGKHLAIAGIKDLADITPTIIEILESA